MALVLYGGGVQNISGSIGGQVHSHNRFGSYIRARKVPVNPKTNRQSEIRSAIQDLAQRWSGSLTQDQRDQWEVYAAAITRKNALGGQIKLTGFNHYIRSNSIRLQNALNTIGDGPGILTLPPGDPLFACTVDEAAQEISVTFTPGLDWNDEDFGHMFISMSIPKAAGVAFVGGPFRQAGFLTGINGAPPASPQVLDAPFQVSEGQIVKCIARISQEDGRLSDFFLDQAAVTA